MKLHIVDILIICAYLMVIVAIGFVFEKEGGKEYGFLFFGRKVVAVLYVGAVECIGHV